MPETEAERLARIYGGYREADARSRRWATTNPGNRRIVAERAGRAERMLRRHFGPRLAMVSVLEVGCGTGDELARLLDLGLNRASLHGVDLLADRVRQAYGRHPGLHLAVGDATRLPFGDARFDLVLALTLFSSILDPDVAQAASAEMTRVLAPGGAVLWYDFRVDNPLNRNVRGVPARRIRQLFPGLRAEFERVTLVPQLARRLGRAAWLYPVLAQPRFLRTHLLGLLTA